MTDSCASPDLLSLDQALRQILDALPIQDSFEQLSIKNALNRVIYQPITSAINVPSFRNSSMDGYAVHSSDCNSKSLAVVGISWAGKPYTKSITRGQCVRIFTGAYVPDCCDSVVMQENVQRTNDTIEVIKWPGLLENIRNIGDETTQGQLLFDKGHYLKAADIGLLASSGISDVAVFRPIKAGFFSTGDELVSLGSQLQLGQIFDSNRYTLHALLEEAGVTPIDMGVIPDNPESVEAALLSATSSCDVIITTGGVSVGDADFITDVLAKIGKINLWKIAIKPGKPLVYGSIKDTVFFGLPGNPVSVMVTFKQVVLPALQKLMGLKDQRNNITLQAIAAENIIKQAGRMEFQRGFVKNINGQLVVSTTGGQGSHMLTSMSKANCFIVLEKNNKGVEKGQPVNIQLLGTHL